MVVEIMDVRIPVLAQEHQGLELHDERPGGSSDSSPPRHSRPTCAYLWRGAPASPPSRYGYPAGESDHFADVIGKRHDRST